MKKLYIKTYGCQMNEYDSARIADLLHETHNFELIDDPNEADLILLNTCSIRDKAQEKVFSDLGRFRLLKQKNPKLIIGVGGCVAAQEQKKIIQRAPFVDLVFGPQTIHRLPELLDTRLSSSPDLIGGSKKLCKVIDSRLRGNDKISIEKFAYLPEPSVNGPTAFVTIMEGCDKFCSYCIVPYTRGREISRPFADVMNEVKILTNNGVKEITFLGQNVNDYTYNLAELIYKTAEINNIERIRFTTSYPSSLNNELISAYANEPKLANHLHLPVQSGSNKILRAMRRRYTAEEYQEKIANLRQARPDISITSDFIVGFPGETDEDFAVTMDLVKTINFDNSFSFIYSPRPGTLAAKLPDDLPLEHKKERLTILQKQLNLQAAAYSNKMLGTTPKVLVTGSSKKNPQELSGRTENNRVVNFAGEQNLIGKIIDIQITEVLPNSLRGNLT